MNKNKLLIISIISLALFVILLLNLNNISGLDKSINSAIPSIQTPILVNISKIIGTILEPTYVVIASVIISLILFLFKNRKEALFFGLTMLATGGIGYILKEVISRARPENALVSESLSAFPSGHALVSIVLVGFIIYFISSKIKSNAKKTIVNILLILLVLLIGFSRIYLNVHWASDVLSGFLLGVFIFYSSLALRKIF